MWKSFTRNHLTRTIMIILSNTILFTSAFVYGNPEQIPTTIIVVSNTTEIQRSLQASFSGREDVTLLENPIPHPQVGVDGSSIDVMFAWAKVFGKISAETLRNKIYGDGNSQVLIIFDSNITGNLENQFGKYTKDSNFHWMDVSTIISQSDFSTALVNRIRNKLNGSIVVEPRLTLIALDDSEAVLLVLKQHFLPQLVSHGHIKEGEVKFAGFHAPAGPGTLEVMGSMLVEMARLKSSGQKFIVLLDLELSIGEGGGWVAAINIRKLDPQIPIIIYSSREITKEERLETVDLRDGTSKARFDHSVLKIGLNFSELRELVLRYLSETKGRSPPGLFSDSFPSCTD